MRDTYGFHHFVILCIFFFIFFLLNRNVTWTNPERVYSEVSPYSYKYNSVVLTIRCFEVSLGRRGVNHNNANNLFKVIHEIVTGVCQLCKLFV